MSFPSPFSAQRRRGARPGSGQARIRPKPGSSVSDRPADQAGRERIVRNNALFDKWDARSVPLIVWRGPDDTDRKHLGDIADIGVWLREAGFE